MSIQHLSNSADVGTFSRERPVSYAVSDFEKDAGRLTIRHVRAFVRWMRLRWRFSSLAPGLFFVDDGVVVEIGSDVPVTVGQGVVILRDVTALLYGPTSIGQRTLISRGAYLSCVTGLTIGADCLIGEHVSIHDMDHAFGAEYTAVRLPDRPLWGSPVRIGDNVWIGTKSTITRGVTVGDDSVVAAGSVVVRDVPPHSLVAGAPARVVRSWAPANA